MSNTYTTTGIILKRRDYLENDRLFVVYTSDFGKIDFLAKGTKKISSKLNSYLEPFYLVKLMIAKGKAFDKLANCDLIKTYSKLRTEQTLTGFYLLSYLAEVTDGLIVGQTMQKDKFELFEKVLDLLDKEIEQVEKNKERLLMIANIYCLKLLNLLGYQPEIQRCLICHKGLLLTKNIFDFTQGGIICENCKKVCLIEDFIEVSDEIIKILQLAQEKDLNFFTSLIVSLNTLKQFNEVVKKLILVNLEKPLKVLDFKI